MTTVTRKQCDACLTIYQQDCLSYTYFGRYTRADGAEREICGDCEARLFEPFNAAVQDHGGA